MLGSGRPHDSVRDDLHVRKKLKLGPSGDAYCLPNDKATTIGHTIVAIDTDGNTEWQAGGGGGSSLTGDPDVSIATLSGLPSIDATDNTSVVINTPADKAVAFEVQEGGAPCFTINSTASGVIRLAKNTDVLGNVLATGVVISNALTNTVGNDIKVRNNGNTASVDVKDAGSIINTVNGGLVSAYTISDDTTDYMSINSSAKTIDVLQNTVFGSDVDVTGDIVGSVLTSTVGNDVKVRNNGDTSNVICLDSGATEINVADGLVDGFVIKENGANCISINTNAAGTITLNKNTDIIGNNAVTGSVITSALIGRVDDVLIRSNDSSSKIHVENDDILRVESKNISLTDPTDGLDVLRTRDRTFPVLGAKEITVYARGTFTSFAQELLDTFDGNGATPGWVYEDTDGVFDVTGDYIGGLTTNVDSIGTPCAIIVISFQDQFGSLTNGNRTVTGYALSSAPGVHPVDFRLLKSSGGGNWTTIDNQSGVTGPQYDTTTPTLDGPRYQLAAPETTEQLALMVTKNAGDTMDIKQITFFDDSNRTLELSASADIQVKSDAKLVLRSGDGVYVGPSTGTDFGYYLPSGGGTNNSVLTYESLTNNAVWAPATGGFNSTTDLQVNSLLFNELKVPDAVDNVATVYRRLYPDVNMTNNIDQGYIAAASGNVVGNPPWKAFDGLFGLSDRWINDFFVAGVGQGETEVEGVGTVMGEYLDIQFKDGVRLDGFQLSTVNNPAFAPQDISVVYSKASDRSKWYPLYEGDGVYGSFLVQQEVKLDSPFIELNMTEHCTWARLIVRTNGGGVSTSIFDLRYRGIPEVEAKFETLEVGDIKVEKGHDLNVILSKGRGFNVRDEDGTPQLQIVDLKMPETFFTGPTQGIESITATSAQIGFDAWQLLDGSVSSRWLTVGGYTGINGAYTGSATPTSYRLIGDDILTLIAQGEQFTYDMGIPTIVNQFSILSFSAPSTSLQPRDYVILGTCDDTDDNWRLLYRPADDTAAIASITVGDLPLSTTAAVINPFVTTQAWKRIRFQCAATRGFQSLSIKEFNVGFKQVETLPIKCNSIIAGTSRITQLELETPIIQPNLPTFKANLTTGITIPNASNDLDFSVNWAEEYNDNLGCNETKLCTLTATGITMNYAGRYQIFLALTGPSFSSKQGCEILVNGVSKFVSPASDTDGVMLAGVVTVDQIGHEMTLRITRSSTGGNDNISAGSITIIKS